MRSFRVTVLQEKNLSGLVVQSLLLALVDRAGDHGDEESYRQGQHREGHW